MKNIDNVGILLRGKSIKDLPDIIDNFETCFIVNWHKEEFDLLGKYILGKNIIQYSNLKHCIIFPDHIYKKYDITIVGLPFCESMLNYKRAQGWLKRYKKMGIKEIVFLPEEHIGELEIRPKNSGMICIFYCSEILKAKKIWVAGLDFYTTDYITKEIKNKYSKKAKRVGIRNKMIEKFNTYIETFPSIHYNVLSQYEHFSKFDNLNVLISEGGEISENNTRFNWH